MKRKVILAVLVVLIVGTLSVLYSRYRTAIEFLCSPVSQAVCYRAVDSAFKIDGRLDELSWQKAETLSFVVSADPSEKVASYPGKLAAKWCWDDDNWYVAFIFDTPDINAPKNDKKDWRSWQDDAVEIFIDPDGDTRDYYGLEITPRGYVLDYIAPGGYTLWSNQSPGKINKAWDFDHLEFGIVIDGTLDKRDDTDTRWICEIAIPWTSLSQVPGGGKRPVTNTVWRVNLLANDFLPPKGKQYIELMWSQCYDLNQPTYVFHEPRRFGEVVFSGKRLGE